MRLPAGEAYLLTDPLTGVGSRRLLEDKLQMECERVRRYNRSFSVAIIDLDHFKIINDTLGHAAGDEAIKAMARRIEEQKRKPDVLARYGGDEFVMLIPAGAPKPLSCWEESDSTSADSPRTGLFLSIGAASPNARSRTSLPVT
jgi:diguanylate cyclase (GGDEF)-like protein